MGKRDESAKERAEQAYQEYLNLRNGRSLEGLRKVLYQKYAKSIPLITLKTWSSKYKWQDRIAASVAKVQAKVNATFERNIMQTKRRQEQLVDVAISAWLTKFKQDRDAGIYPDVSYADLIKILNHELVLKGIIKEPPAIVNQMNAMQVQLTPQAEFLDKVLKALPGDIRDVVSRTWFEMREEEQAKAIELQPREADILDGEQVEQDPDDK